MRPVRPSEVRSRAALKLAIEEPCRLVLEIPPALRVALKVRAAERRMTIKAYVISLLEADGVRPDE